MQKNIIQYDVFLFRFSYNGNSMNNHPFRRRAVIALLAIAFMVAAGALSYRYILPATHSVLSLLPSVSFEWPSEPQNSNSAEQFATKEPAKQVSLPPPLRGATSSPKTSPPKPTPAPVPTPTPTLTRAGIIADTNIQRKINGGLPALLENTTLDAIATARMVDMFQKQYFAHVAPDGGSSETIAKTFNYEYLALGENIALGIFAGNADLVDAWMNSPGHRANILNGHFTQIGVAAREGIFEGKTTWIAVQVFGKPTSACPVVDPNLKIAIDNAKNQLSQIQVQIQTKKAELEAMEPKYGNAYNQEVDEYNALVRQYNTLLQQTRLQTDQYNAQVAAFNQCV
jgi:uncharacterized protein YkwD